MEGVPHNSCPRRMCATCRFWRPRHESDREPYRKDDGTEDYEGLKAPCGVRPPTEWIKTPGYLLVEPPHTVDTDGCQFWEAYIRPDMTENADLSDKSSEHVASSAFSDRSVGLVERVARALAEDDGWEGGWDTYPADSMLAREEYRQNARAAIREVADALDEAGRGPDVDPGQRSAGPAYYWAVRWLRSQLEEE